MLVTFGSEGNTKSILLRPNLWGRYTAETRWFVTACGTTDCERRQVADAVVLEFLRSADLSHFCDDARAVPQHYNRLDCIQADWTDESGVSHSHAGLASQNKACWSAGKSLIRATASRSYWF